MKPGTSGRGARLALTLALAVLLPAAAVRGAAPSREWLPFQGTWSASGERRLLPIEGGGTASIMSISGALVLTAGEELARGFTAEAIGFDNGVGASAGRSVWTDEHGDRLFSTLIGEQVQTGRRVDGTITGGTGRYAGMEGDYTLTWQFVVPAEDGKIQGRTVTLAGRVRRAGVP